MTRSHYFKLVLVACLIGGCVGHSPSPAVARSPSAAGAPNDGESFVVANGATHWVRVAAAARKTTPIVVVHGGPGGNNYAFERTIGPELERFATVIYYEQRGCGRSKPPADANYSMATLVADLDALRATLGLERMHLLGYSFGGELALEYAIAHPRRVERLVLQAPSLGAVERAHAQSEGFEAISRGAMRERIRAIRRAPGSDAERAERIWNVVDTATVDSLLFHDPRKAAPMRRLWEESQLGGPNPEMASLYTKARAGEPLLRRASALDVETLVMVGLYDRNVGVEGPRDLATAMPRAKLVVFEASAHFPDLEEPAKYAVTVKSFIHAH